MPNPSTGVEFPHDLPDKPKKEAVNHPAHYGGADNPYEHIKVSRAWGMNYELGNATKYICRAGKKNDAIEDLKKAAWYIHAEIQRRDPSYTPPQEFKEYVHKVLDSWGVPVDPDPIIGEIKDCRIGRRLRWLHAYLPPGSFGHSSGLITGDAAPGVVMRDCKQCGHRGPVGVPHLCVAADKGGNSPCG